MRNTKVTAIAIASLLVLLVAVSPASAQDEKSSSWAFFAFDNGVGRGTWQPEQQAQLLAELGYDGIGYTGVQNIPEMLRSLHAHNLKMFSTYIQVNLGEDQSPFDPGLPDAIKQLRGEGTALWIHIHGSGPASEVQDRRAVEVIRQIAEMAAASELPVVLYPHTGFYVATTTDAVRMVKLVDRKNVGASFNLCHFLKQNDAAKMETVLRAAAPHLMLVSINGADQGDTRKMGWDRLIQTLDQGSFDVKRVLKVLSECGYRGPVGLQCYAIKGDIRENLAKSIGAWRAAVGER